MAFHTRIPKKGSNNKSASSSETPQNTTHLEDNRNTPVAQKKEASNLENKQTTDSPIQKKVLDSAPTENNTGLPDNLKSGIENLSGHSMDDVKVHYNSSQPAQLNAHAYAQGTNIHIASGQEKHLPHEAWHVVQQKQGRVKPTMQMKEKVNVNDDKSLEKEADVMGTLALKSKETSENRIHTSPPKDTVQGYFIVENVGGVFFLGQESRTTQTGKTFLNESGKANVKPKRGGKMRISDTGEMAIEDGGSKRQSKIFYATSKIINAANARLKQIGSPIRLATNTGISISTNVKGQKKKLSLIYPVDIQEKKIGDEVEIPQRCNEAGPYVGNTQNDGFLRLKSKQDNTHILPNVPLMGALDQRLAALLPLLLKKKKFESGGIIGTFFESFLPWWENFYPHLDKLQRISVPGFTDHLQELGGNKSRNYDSASVKRGINLVGKQYVEEFIQKEGSDEILKEIGLNEHIDPEVGDILSIRSIGAERNDHQGNWYLHDYHTGMEKKNPFQYHFATVIAKSGKDYITMENYARQEEEGDREHTINPKDPRCFFQMFGPLEQSFHSENKSEYANPMTLSFAPTRVGKIYENELGTPGTENKIEEYNHKLNLIHSQT